jgi:hypothetical protein
MRDQIENRLLDLKNEYDQGKKILAELDGRREKTVQAMLRISGAIQVLEDMLAEEENVQTEAIKAQVIQTDAIEQPRK